MGRGHPDDGWRGLFTGEVAAEKLKLFARLGIKTTWFVLATDQTFRPR